jgi:hypothetical protein
MSREQLFYDENGKSGNKKVERSKMHVAIHCVTYSLVELGMQ